MKHEVISLNTKKMFSEALKRALEQKPLSKISVSEIVSDCGVNRKTFYYHFENINDLLKWIIRQEAIEVVKEMEAITDYEKTILFVIDYIDINEDIIKNIYSMGKYELKQFFYPDFVEIMGVIIENAIQSMQVAVPQDFKEFLIKFNTDAVSDLLQEWILDKSTRNKEKTVQYIQLILHSSITGSLEAAASILNS
ncbi:MAG: TetR/AcrR family transcriptional regulator C-terminal domain-containing protein [Lachnospiraceae bacterium]|nr:TetR/AcrR family transcriptional regulator C-terminal domain-containing protein [Lachnospiraceae bacterium]